MAKLIKKAAVKKAAPKEKRVSAASIVLGMLRMKQCPSDEAIIKAVHDGVESTKFDKTHLAWYKYQFRQGRWNDGEQQVIHQVDTKKAAVKPAKKVAKKAAVQEEEEEVEG